MWCTPSEAKLVFKISSCCWIKNLSNQLESEILVEFTEPREGTASLTGHLTSFPLYMEVRAAMQSRPRGSCPKYSPKLFCCYQTSTWALVFLVTCSSVKETAGEKIPIAGSLWKTAMMEVLLL